MSQASDDNAEPWTQEGRAVLDADGVMHGDRSEKVRPAPPPLLPAAAPPAELDAAPLVASAVTGLDPYAPEARLELELDMSGYAAKSPAAIPATSNGTANAAVLPEPVYQEQVYRDLSPSAPAGRGFGGWLLLCIQVLAVLAVFSVLTAIAVTYWWPQTKLLEQARALSIPVPDLPTLGGAATKKSVLAPGLLWIDSDPSGATIRIGDTVVGSTPWMGDNLYADPNVPVVLELRGYEPWEGTFKGGTEQKLDIPLQKQTKKKTGK